MPKMKTHSGAKKRFRVTGKGVLMRERANRRHLLENKPSTRTRRLALDVTVTPTDRKQRKGDFGQRWIQRINAAARANGMTYNRFVQGLKAAGIEVDRRMLAELAVDDPAAFTALVQSARAALPTDLNAPAA